MANDERLKAIGQVKLLEKKLADLGFRAGSHIESIMQEMNTLLNAKDWFNIDFNYIESLISTLKQLKTDAAEALKQLNELREKYGI